MRNPTRAFRENFDADEDAVAPTLVTYLRKRARAQPRWLSRTAAGPPIDVCQ
jgi:hypothetical protein